MMNMFKATYITHSLDFLSDCTRLQQTIVEAQDHAVRMQRTGILSDDEC